jgi:hypothetical protein
LNAKWLPVEYAGDIGMNTNGIILIIILLTISFIVTSGCIYPTSSENQKNTSYENLTEIIPDVTIPITQCPPLENETAYIIINPIGRHYKGETFEINGTTNLRADEIIYYSIARPMEPRPTGAPGPGPDYHVTSGIATTVTSGCTTQSWSFIYNSNEYFSNVNMLNIYNGDKSVENYSIMFNIY